MTRPLENLIEVVPSDCAPALQEPLTLLDGSIERTYSEIADRAAANVRDYQGIGGHR
jgi:hypothetical protein